MPNLPQSTIARELEISVTNLRKHLAKQDAPQKNADGSYDLDEVRLFIQTERKRDAQRKVGGDYSKAKAATELFRAKLLEVKYKEQIKRLLPRDEVETRQQEMCLLVRYAFQSMKHKLPPLLIGKDLPSMSKIIGAAVDECFDELSTQSDEQDTAIIERVEAAYQAQLRELDEARRKRKAEKRKQKAGQT
jgi:hypothetical protein